jgi:23S rRNA (guanosine2251-2'-O)-methyltransferase
MEIKSDIIYGRNPVVEALRFGKIKIEKIYIRFGSKGYQIDRIVQIARKNNVPVSMLEKTKFNRLEQELVRSEDTQGVIALISPINYLELEELVQIAFSRQDNPVLVFLDRIQDPQNLGAIARTSECAGVGGLVMTTKDTAPVNATVIKASAGGILNIPVARVSSSSQALEFLKSKGFWIVGTAPTGGRIYTEGIYDQPIVVAIGSEGKGLSKSVLKHCDYIVEIPVFGKVESLNASVSAGIILYEILRQRGSFGSK